MNLEEKLNQKILERTEMKHWEGMDIVRVSDKKGFKEFLGEQTRPVVEGDETPMDWAYYEDYVRFVRALRVID